MEGITQLSNASQTQPIHTLHRQEAGICTALKLLQSNSAQLPWKVSDRVCWLTPAILALGLRRQEVCWESKASRSYIVSFRPKQTHTPHTHLVANINNKPFE